MGPYAGNGDLCLREFSKSLDDKAYTWYTTLPPRTVKTWKDMVELFCGKYFQVEEKITLVNLHSTKQASGEYLLHYIHHFCDISLDCYGNYEESELVRVCIDNMLPEFRAHLENLDLSRFAQLLQKARKTALSIKPHIEKPREKKSQPQVLTVSTVNNKRKKSTEKLFEEPPPPVPCTTEEMIAILDKWVADGIVKLSEAQKKATKEHKKNLKFCCFHRDADMDEPVAMSTTMTPTAIKTLQRNPRFRSFFNQLGLNLEARTAATETIMTIAAKFGAHCFTAETHACRTFLETTNAITFTDEDMDVQCAGANCPQQEAPKPGEGILQPSCLTMNKANYPESADVAAEGATVADLKISAKEELKLIDLSSDPNDAEKTAFCTPIGNFYCIFMPFGLKNAGATYQRTITAIFHDMMHREIEDYVDDIVVKSKKREDHFGILKKVFERCRLYKFKMNPLKCAFGVSIGKFSGFLVHQRGIDVDPTRASAIATMKSPTTHKELKSFLEKLSYIRRFIPGLAAMTSTFALLIKKGGSFHWSTECQQAFEKLSQYEIVIETPTTIKSQAIVDLLAQFPGEDNSSISDEVPGEIDGVILADLADSTWTLRFEDSSTATSGGAGIVLYKGNGKAITKPFKLDFPCSDNATEYEAYLTGLAITYEMGIKHLRVISDSNLVHAQRNENRYADALATLGSQMTFEGQDMDITIRKKMEPITELLKSEFEELPLGVLARCISMQEARKKLLKIHEKACEDGKAINLYRRLQRLGYFWPNMSAEAADLQSQCPTCQLHHNNEEVCATFISTDWRTPFLEYLLEGILPPNPKDVYCLKRLALRCLVGIRSSPKTATGFTPFLLVYGTDTISPTELVVPSPQVMQGNELKVDANMCAEARMADLEGLDEERKLAKARSQRNYKKMANVYSKALQARVFVECQMFLKAAEFVRRGLPSPSKFSPNWDGPYVVRESHESGYYKLSMSDGTILIDPINGKWLKHHYSYDTFQ
uniref:RNase H type-1 domain-containing protein n=1 Tax=Fagus sylvatica TaxID=28930 RepID=A0A2N9IHX9_FAGSY